MGNTNERIKTGVERSVKALTLKPSLGHGTGHSTVTVKDGLTCEVVEGPWRFVVDMPTSVGGAAAGPTPGVYGRGALGSCLAIGYMMHAARLGMPIDSLGKLAAACQPRTFQKPSRLWPGGKFANLTNCS